MKFSKLLVLSVLSLFGLGAQAVELIERTAPEAPATTTVDVASLDKTPATFVVGNYYVIFNKGAQQYFGEGNAWGTQASLSDTPNLARFTLPAGKTLEDATLLFNDYSAAKGAWKLVFFDSATAMFVDRGSQANYYWQIVEGGEPNTYRLQASPSNPTLNPTNNPGFVGVAEAAAAGSALSPFLASGWIDWEFYTVPEWNEYGVAKDIFDKSQELKLVIEAAEAEGVDVTAAANVYNNVESTLDQMVQAVNDLEFARKNSLNGATADSPKSATAFITIQPIKGLRFRSQFNYSWGSGAYRNYNEPRSTGYGNATSIIYSVNQNAWLNTNFSVENTLTYDLPIIAGHKISAMVGQSFQSTAWSANLNGSNSVNDGSQYATLKDWDSAWLANFSTDLANATLSGSPNDEEYLASWFGRVTWDWNEKYMATVTLRYDGSSIFNKGQRWGLFPSFSAGWVVSNESFMASTSSWLDFLKIRASWGQNGNNRISKYQYLATIAQSGSNGDSGYKFSDSMDVTLTGTPNTGAYANIVPNPDVTWETSEQLDFGLDARFLNNRLGVNFDWYKKTTKDWLIVAPRVAIEGTNPAYINGGDVKNTGIEIALSWNDRIGKDFSYNASVNFATNKNEVTRIANETGYINGGGSVLSQGTEYIYRAQVGKPIGYFYGMSYSGIWQNQEQIDAARAAGKAVLDGAQPGDCIWDDWNGDGKITYAEAKDADGNDICDRHEIGNPNPDVTLGINLGLTWKGLDFSVNGAGAFGMQIMRSYRSFSDSWWHNYDTTILNRWHGEGTSNDVPRISGTGHANTNYVSTRYMEDADYFKIKTITLGYDFKKIWKSCPLQQLRLYVQAQNLVTFTGYTGLDPEVGNAAGGDSWASGIDLGLYPPSRTYLVGASIKF